MKTKIFITIATALLFLCLPFELSAQEPNGNGNVTVRVTIAPPYSPYYSDYYGANASKVMIFIQNNSPLPRSVKLAVELEGDNGIKIVTKPGFSPLTPILLNPFETKQLSGDGLKDALNPNHVNISGIDKNKLIYSAQIPEGNYSFCVKALDFNSGRVLSMDTFLGCNSITIAYPEAPILIAPLPMETVAPLNPQFVQFSWINTGTVPLGIQYLFQLIEIPENADPNQILNASSFPLINKTLNQTTYVLSPSDPPLKTNATYAWRVKALDPTGKITFKNDGFSTASIFNYSKPMEAPSLISPANLAEMLPSDQLSINFNWEKIESLTPINYTLQIAEIPENKGDLSKFFNKNTIVSHNTIQNQFLFVDKGQLQNGKTYAWRVLVVAEDKSIRFTNDYSAIYSFKLNSDLKKDVLASAPKIKTPTNLWQLVQKEQALQPEITIEWDAAEVSYPVKYNVDIIKIPSDISAEQAVNNNLPALFSRTTSGTKITFNPNKDIDPKSIYQKLEDQGNYAIVLHASPTEQLPINQPRIENNGRSNIVVFSYQESAVAAPNTPISTTISGRLLYRYKEINEQPKSTALSFPSVTTKVISGVASNIVVEKFDNNEYPDVVANSIFSMGNNPQPLKNVTLNFIYVIYSSNLKNPTKLSDLSLLDAGELLSAKGLDYPEKKITINNKSITYNTRIGTTKGKSDGSFQITTNNAQLYGYLGSQNNKSYFGALKIVLSESGYYTSPDLIIFPKSGKHIKIGDDIVFPKSYNLEVKLNAKNKNNQIINFSNYPVQIMEKGSTEPIEKAISPGNNLTIPGLPIVDDPSTLPKEANADSYATGNKMDGKIIDIAKTNGLGIAQFNHLLLSHSHQSLAISSPFEGTEIFQDAYGKPVYGSFDPKLGPITFSTDFLVETKKMDITLVPKKPEIYIRAVTKQNGVVKGLDQTTVRIQSYDASSNKLISTINPLTDENGYFKMDKINENQTYTITLIKNGYENKIIVREKQKLSLGERFPSTTEQEMVGSSKIQGFVVDESGKPISVNIRAANGAFLKFTNGTFVVNNVPTGMVDVEIIPTVDHYFPEKISVSNRSNTTTLVTNIEQGTEGKIVLKEKLHRAQFKVLNEAGESVNDAQIQIGTSKTTLTNARGMSPVVAIASPDNEFKVKVTSSGYVTLEDYFLIPLSKNANLITLKLKKGRTITGTVLDAISGKPIANARVYTISGSNEDGEVQTQTYTDANGKYSLTGIESSLDYLSQGRILSSQGLNGIARTINVSQNNTSIKIFAVKTGTDSYLRQEKTVTNSSNVNFQLSALNASSEIWGLPIEVNTWTNDVDGIKISGNFVNLPSNENFKLQSMDTKLPFSNLRVVLVKPNNQGSKNTIQPISEKIDLQKTSIKLVAFEKFNTEAIGSDLESKKHQLLSIEQVDGSGVLKGYITSELSSFNFSYAYNGKFLFNTPNTSIVMGKTINMVPTTQLPIFFAGSKIQLPKQYALSALYKKDSFNIHNFKASISGGLINKEGYSITPTLTLSIPMVDTKVIPAGTIKITNESIQWQQHQSEINLNLEKWKIKGTGLAYDINKGGFAVINGALLTDLPQIDLKNIMIMPNSIDLGISNLSGKEQLKLGGIADLTLSPNSTVTLSYDHAAPFDQKPHYRLNILSNNKFVASINNLPGLSNQALNIKMLSSYSTGEHRTFLMEEKKITYHNVVSQTLSGIEVGDGFFTLIGNTDLLIPGANANVTGRFKYFRDVNSKVALSVDKLETNLEMAGKVRFEGDGFMLATNLFTATGKVFIYKNSVQDAIQGIRGKLSKQNTGSEASISFEILPDQRISMNSKALKILTGGSAVVGNKWTNLKFTGQLDGFNSGGQLSKNLFEENQDKLDFEVKGGIETDKNSKKAIKLSDINTPFGDFSLTFDFDNKIFQGSLTLKSASIVLGPVTIMDGSVDLQIDGNGFIVVGAITNANLTAPLPSVIREKFKSGIALGYYNTKLPDYMMNKLLDVTLYKSPHETINTGLKGFFVNVMKTIDKSDLPKVPGPNIDQIAFAPTYDFAAGIDLHAYLNVNNGFEVGIGGQAFAFASVNYDLLLCNVGYSAKAQAEFQLRYRNALEGKMTFNLEGELHYCVGKLNAALELQLVKETDKFEFKASIK